MESNDIKIQELYKLLNISQEDYSQYPQIYDIITPFEKCSASVDIPTTIGNSTLPTNEQKKPIVV